MGYVKKIIENLNESEDIRSNNINDYFQFS